MTRAVRVGIDVGGTFTHAVAVDNQSLEIIAHQVVPTSHAASAGVAAGIVEVFSRLLEALPSDSQIVFLAHSTTQATNALLEGDVAKVGIIGLASGLEAVKAKNDINVGDIELSPGKFLPSLFCMLSPEASEAQITEALENFQKQGAGAVVAAQSFSVDDPSGEQRVLAQAAQINLPACATHEMSGLYGLRVRTGTAVLNASILPKMIATAVMTAQALQSRDVAAPLMVMRSDGGVMSLEEVRRRPVMTLLSGPAAGIAACLMFIKATDALFLEVGGTSTDMCLIKDGKAAVRSASVGGHPTYLRTLDSRTLGIAGGSMISSAHGHGLTVGPRSAHLAGYKYCAFAEVGQLSGALTVKESVPFPGDPPYLVVENAAGEVFAPTTTCAANFLKYIKPGDYSYGHPENVTAAFTALAEYLNARGQSFTAESLARSVLDKAAEIVLPTAKKLIAEYKMENRNVKLIGGGGGSGAIVPVVAEKLGLTYEIAQHAEVISAIGAALAMVRECLERNLLNPSQDDLAKLRAEAENAVIKMGADPESVEVTVEVDAAKNVVRATALGSVAFAAGGAVLGSELSEEEITQTVSEALPGCDSYQLLGKTDNYRVYECKKEKKVFFGFLKRRSSILAACDNKGTVRLQVPNGIFRASTGAQSLSDLTNLLHELTSYGDAGALMPQVRMISGRKLIDLSSLVTEEQIVGLARNELVGVAATAAVLFLAVKA